MVEIEVEDDGRGIPEAERVSIFDRGARLDTGKPGTGLGLAIVRDVAQIYGGTVVLEESEDLGRSARAAEAAGGRVAPLAFALFPAHIAAQMSAEIIPLVPNRTPSLDPMMQLVAADLNHVNAVILERMQSEVALIPELAGHLIAGGGKRMRPMLTLASAACSIMRGTRHHKLAAAVEFIHTATLLHDDVVDGSGLRRGKRTANIIWGNPASVLVGDFLFSRAASN